MSEFIRQQTAPGTNPVVDARTPDQSRALVLQRLDALLTRAIASAQARYVRDDSANPLRGLYVTPEQAKRALDGSAGEPLSDGLDQLRTQDWTRIVEEDPSWGWLRTTYGLSAYDLDLVLIALGPGNGPAIRTGVRLPAGRPNPSSPDTRPGLEYD